MLDLVLAVLCDPGTWIFVLIIAAVMLYRYGTSTFHVFSDQGIPGPKPLPFIGNLWGIWKQNMYEVDMKRAKQYGKIFGLFDALEPNLWIADPEIIKSILVKDFDHFVNHKDFGAKSEVIRKMVFFLQDQEWKDVHASLSPAFSAGKVKKMSGLFKEVVDRRTEKLKDMAHAEGKFDAKRYFGILILDIITRAFYGLKIDNLGEKDDPFINHAMKLSWQLNNQSASMLIPFLFPRFFSGDYMLRTDAWKFFKNVLESAIQERSKSNQKYNDFLEITSDSILSYANDKKKWSPEETDEIIWAQALEFLVDGYEMAASALAYVCYQLSKNPEIQEKFYEEVVEKLEKFGEVKHEMLLEMTYADQIINETLRMYPLLARLDRLCNKDISYNGIHIKKGMIVTVPVYVLHHSEEYYNDPETFDPERWSPEHQRKINPYAFLPFGSGPRGCIGARLAMEQLKMALCTLIQHFRFFPVEETLDKMTFTDGYGIVVNSHNIILGVEIRNP